jgi:hypothetical protein
VQEAVADCVGQVGITDARVPVLDRELAGDGVLAASLRDGGECARVG